MHPFAKLKYRTPGHSLPGPRVKEKTEHRRPAEFLILEPSGKNLAVPTLENAEIWTNASWGLKLQFAPQSQSN